MRNFIDTWQTLFDDKGLPLIGRLYFYEVNTTTLKEVYSIDGIKLSNPIYVNVVPEHQVMLSDDDYTIAFEKYIGNGNFKTDEAPESWLQFKTILSKSGVSETSKVTTDIIEGIQPLRELNVSDLEEYTKVRVDGYYTVTDCPTRYYTWYPNSTATEDGGVIIKSSTSTTGRWIMDIPYDYIDVRWYGDIPNSTLTDLKNYLSNRALAAHASNTYHKKLYFPYGYYLFDGSNTVSTDNDIVLDNDTKWVIKEGTSGTKITCATLDRNSTQLFISENGASSIGGYLLECDWIDVAWFDGNKAMAEGAINGYIIKDRQNSPLTYKDTKLKVTSGSTLVSGVKLDNVEVVEGNGFISNSIQLSNLKPLAEWFVDDYDYSLLTISDCDIQLGDFSGNVYITLKNKQNESNYGSLSDRPISGVTLLSGAIISNTSGDVVLTSNGGYTFEDVTLSIPNTQVRTLNITSSNVSFPNGITVTEQFESRDSNVSGTLTVVDVCNIWNSALEDIDYRGTNTLAIVKSSMTKLDIKSGATTSQTINLTDCIINELVGLEDYSSTSWFVSGCHIAKGNKLQIGGTYNDIIPLSYKMSVTDDDVLTGSGFVAYVTTYAGSSINDDDLFEIVVPYEQNKYVFNPNTKYRMENALTLTLNTRNADGVTYTNNIQTSEGVFRNSSTFDIITWSDDVTETTYNSFPSGYETKTGYHAYPLSCVSPTINNDRLCLNANGSIMPGYRYIITGTNANLYLRLIAL